MAPISLGEHLKKLREERGISLEQAALGTHIRLPYLQALEEDQRELLPSAVQGKGFLRVYASYLEVPAQPLLDAWDRGGWMEETVLADPLDELLAREVQQTTGTAEVTVEPKPSASPAPLPEPEEAEDEDLELDEWDLPGQELTPSDELFRQIGAELRRQRESISLTLDEVERFTRIKRHYLIAIEEGRMDALPSPVQGRGMLSNYARFLNMDDEGLLLRYAEGLQARRLERSPDLTPAPGAKKRRPARWVNPKLLAIRRVITLEMVLGVTLFTLLLVFVIWETARVRQQAAMASEVTPPSVSEMLQLTATPSLTPTLEPERTYTQQPNALPADALEATNLAITAAAEGTLPASSDPVQIHVIANQRAYLRVIADGDVVFSGRTRPGSAYSFSAEERIELVTGNAAALQIFYQQQNLGNLGVVGQVLSMIFEPGQMITPTVQFTPTATVTPTPTVTIEPTRSEPTATITPYLP
ncbi:MAG TPA: DUF4115 domain-containing protein [Chloroflexi bacterium]|nr:DUF4115 domain-containing protein [Chloroflexota bacterium]